MIIQYRQWVTPLPIRHQDVTLEIRLPQLIVPFSFKSFERSVGKGSFLGYHPISSQYVIYCPDTRHAVTFAA